MRPSGVKQSCSGCEVLSQLKGISSVSTLEGLHSLIQRTHVGKRSRLQLQPLEATSRTYV